MPVIPLHTLTSQSLDAKFAKKQRRYDSKYSASYLHHPSPPPKLVEPPRPPNPTFEALRAAAARLNLPTEDDQYGPPAAAAALPARRHPIRKALLGTAAALALCALAAAGYCASAARTPEDIPAVVNAALASLAQRVHDLAADQAVFRTVGERIALLLPTSPPAPEAEPVVPPAPDGPTGDTALRPAPPSARPVAAAAVPTPEPAGQADPAPAQAEPGRFPPVAAASSDAAEAAEAAEAAAGSAPPGVTAQQLADTIALVRQMGLLMRDMQAENERLRTQAAGSAGVLQGKVADLEQRLAATAQGLRDARDEYAQARAQAATLADALQASSKAIEQRLGPAFARDPAGAASRLGKRQADPLALPAPASSGDGNAAAADATAAGFARTARDYHVEAASLGMAVLGDANSVPGQGARYLVSVGDQVPGVGRVTSITQRGTSWVVQTDHGAIQ